MAEGVYYQTSMLMRWFEEKGFPVHPNIRKANQRFQRKIMDVEMDLGLASDCLSWEDVRPCFEG